MWAALRSDLKEFVSSVAEETSGALDAIDNQLGASNSEDSRPFFSPQSAYQGRNFFTSGLYDDALELPSLEEELERFRNLEDTYTLPLDEQDEDVKNFLATFVVKDKTEDIAVLLEAHPETIKRLFEELVPTTVAYNDFWTRYYYRCDEERIQSEWEKEEKRASEATAEAIRGGMDSVKSVLGGAVKVVSNIASDSTNLTGNKGFFGAPGRPPFVMNTAVDEDEGDEDEEELGWDDDDDDDEDNDKNISQRDTSHEIVFEHGNLDPVEVGALKEQLKKLQLERNSFKAQVESQAKEISSYKEASTAAAASSGSSHSEELDQLKLTVFEKDSELAALKASLNENSQGEGGGGDGLNVEQELSAKSVLVETLKKELVSAKDEIRKSDARVQELQQQLAKAEKEATDSKAAVTTLEAELSTTKTELDSIKTTAQDVAKAGDSKLISVTEELEKTKTELDAEKARVNELTSEVERLKGDDKNKSNDESSGEKINATSSDPSTEDIVLDEDDWGDSWGEE
eukprot:CAMPEP_0118706566 /NCGR_PEP_ID=MMETSP0800-20121206/20638_1 /TAXON_ID=210618 ORGANISM="Striatella unipunctata, Strain CCMP2910" /NCGR_SAMPLE_ID=MMETSP0800 /ASSEMBLY_ACC=CAM_ASM_000638 /LENGTH=514 /DNA_ID=CAMNT_0006609133 /DNA_START=153 /DNA_END=1697 /DNA_ORIENTATION=+